jgi:hypothetical protein
VAIVQLRVIDADGLSNSKAGRSVAEPNPYLQVRARWVTLRARWVTLTKRGGAQPCFADSVHRLQRHGGDVLGRAVGHTQTVMGGGAFPLLPFRLGERRLHAGVCVSDPRFLCTLASPSPRTHTAPFWGRYPPIINAYPRGKPA